MPRTRIFISSTVEDLKDTRFHLTDIIRNLGHEPVYFEDVNFFSNPALNTVESCLAEVRSSNILVLLVDQKFGSKYGVDGKSVTWAEYEAAVDSGIPVFTLVRRRTMYAWDLYKGNRHREDIDYGVNVEVLKFLTHIAEHKYGNWLKDFDNPGSASDWLQAQLSNLLSDLLARCQTSTGSQLVTSGVSSDQLGEVSVAPRIQLAEGDISSPKTQEEVLPTGDGVHRATELETASGTGSTPRGDSTTDNTRNLATNDHVPAGNPDELYTDLLTRLPNFSWMEDLERTQTSSMLSVYLASWGTPTVAFLEILNVTAPSTMGLVTDKAKRRTAKRLKELFDQSRGFNYRGRLAQLGLKFIDQFSADWAETIAGMVLDSAWDDNEWATAKALEKAIRVVGPVGLSALCERLVSTESRLAIDPLRQALDNPYFPLVRGIVEPFLDARDPD